jgi:ubiquinone/menaquinone biosynthesis C-methylase UbiE
MHKGIGTKIHWEGQWLRDNPAQSNNTLYTYKLLRRESFEAKSVLEVGCGALKVSREWALERAKSEWVLKYAKSYTGLDISEIAITEASRRGIPNSRFIVAEASKLPFANESFDTVVALETLSFTCRDFLTALKEMIRVSKRNIIFDVQHSDYSFSHVSREELRYGTVSHHMELIDAIKFTKGEVDKILDELNLKPVRVVLATADQYASYGTDSYGTYTTDGGGVKKDIYVEAVKRRNNTRK